MRMNIIDKTSMDKLDFELHLLAISAINGCKYCVESHTRKIAQEGISREGVRLTLRIASVINCYSTSYNN